MRKKFLLFLMIITFTGLGCNLGTLQGIKYVHYPQPTLQADAEAFTKAGCIQGEYQRLDCASVPAIAAMPCDQIYTTGDLLGGLDPNLPLAQCEYAPYRHEEYDLESFDGTYFFNSGCSMAFLVKYIVPQGDEFKLVSNPAELAKVFAPIETPEEALSYAMAVSGLSPLYDIKLSGNYRFLADEISDSHVTQTETGYEVLLYDDYLCGCGPHTVSAVRVLVSADGQVQVLEPAPVYQDPKNDDLCID
jgi:hypothetical protein